MSSGKILNKTKKYDNINISSHLFNTKSIKSFYILVSGYYDLDYDELVKLKSRIGKTIKQNLNKEIFHIDRFIQLEEIREYKESTYCGYEYTIYLLKENIITINELEVEALKITDVIYQTYFKNI
jgi:hypothetical protein